MNNSIQDKIDAANKIKLQLDNVSSIKFNSEINPITTQVLPMDDDTASIGGIVVDGLAAATDEYIGTIKSLIFCYVKEQEKILTNQVIN